MRVAKQFTVALANKPGRFSSVLTALQKEKVRSDAFSVMDTDSRGVLRFIPDNQEAAIGALNSINVDYEIHDVLVVDLNNQTGGLPRICQRLAEDHLNIDYSYGSLANRGAKGGGMAVIRVNDLTKAQRILSEAPTGNHQKPKKRPGRRPAHSM